MSGHANYAVAPYGKTCQAAHLLGRVIQHINYEHNLREKDSDMHQAEALQLHRAASSFVMDLDLEYTRETEGQKLKLSTAKAFAHSALLNLYDLHCCIEGDVIRMADDSKSARLDMQNIALQQQKSVSAQVVEFAKGIHAILAVEGVRSISPLICECLYQTAAYFAWNFRESGHSSSLEALNLLRQTLGKISAKWHVASKHTKLVSPQNANNSWQLYISDFLKEQSTRGKVAAASDLPFGNE